MQFWQKVSATSGMSDSLHWVVGGVLVAAIVLLTVRPRERGRVRAALFLFALALAGLLAGGTMLSFGLANHPAYITLRGITRFLEAVAIVNLTGVFIFAVALPAIRLDAPRIMQDLL